MLAKAFKNAALVWVLVILSVSAVMAAPANSALVGGKSSSEGALLEHELEGGLKIVVGGVKKYSNYNGIFLVFTVVTEEDITLKVKGDSIYDNEGREFKRVNETWIGHEKTSERFVIAGVPTLVEVYFYYGNNVKLASTYPRVNFSVNGQALKLRDVPGKE
jgi:hypothetical protein